MTAHGLACAATSGPTRPMSPNCGPADQAAHPPGAPGRRRARAGRVGPPGGIAFRRRDRRRSQTSSPPARTPSPYWSRTTGPRPRPPSRCCARPRTAWTRPSRSPSVAASPSRAPCCSPMSPATAGIDDDRRGPGRASAPAPAGRLPAQGGTGPGRPRCNRDGRRPAHGVPCRPLLRPAHEQRSGDRGVAAPTWRTPEPRTTACGHGCASSKATCPTPSVRSGGGDRARRQGDPPRRDGPARPAGGPIGKVDELTEELRRGGDDPEAARRANRELVAELNRSRPLS